MTATPLPAADILTFQVKNSRAANDVSNKTRESILGSILTTDIHDTDPIYGPAWQTLRTKWHAILTEIGTQHGLPAATPFTVSQKGGRAYNYDYLVTYTPKKTIAQLRHEAQTGHPISLAPPLEIRVEFKYGGTSVTSIPEFFNPAADKPFHAMSYARFWYEGYLDRFLEAVGLSPTDKPSEEEYLASVHTSNGKGSVFFASLIPLRKAGRLTEASNAIVNESITAFLELVKDTTDLAAITAEFQRSQTGKEFVFYEGGEFHVDHIPETALTCSSVIGVRNGNVLCIQSADASTEYRMLLRWKNDKGVLYPAWQISMHRGV